MAIQISHSSTGESQQNRLAFVHALLKGKVVKCGGYYKAHCPAHRDEAPSLSIWEDPNDGHCVINCFAHCDRSAICSALGIVEADLYYNENNKRNMPEKPRLSVVGLASAKGLDPGFLEEIGVTGGHTLEWEKGSQHGAIQIAYHNLDGSTYERSHIRQETSSRNSPWYPAKDPNHPPIPYGLARLHMCKREDTLFITEGESDCWTLWYHGFHALGLPGAGMTDKLDKAHIALLPAHIVILQDPNIAGEKFTFLVKNKLRAKGYTGEIAIVRLPWGDANDLNKKLFAEDKLAQFRALFLEAVKVVVPEKDLPAVDQTNGHVIEARPVTVKALLDFMENMQYGDGQLFRACFKDQVVYDNCEKEWYLWRGHHWSRDFSGKLKVLISGHLGAVYMNACGELLKERAEREQELRILQSTETSGGDLQLDLTKELSPEQTGKIEEIKKRIAKIDAVIKAFQHRAKDLRTDRYKTGVEHYAEESVAIGGADEISPWDRHRALLGVKNGVLNLTTGEFSAGRPTDYIRSVCPTEWRGLNEACPLFEKYLQDIFELRPDRDEVIAFLQRLLGYALTGTCKEAIFVLLYGPEGRNGKTSLFQILMSAIGKNLVGNIEKEILLDSKHNPQANGAKPDVLELQGKRIAIAAETKKGDKLNLSNIKLYSGGDELGGRPVYGKRKITFEPTHTTFMHTNFKPHADSLDDAFWQRACVIEFGMRFVDEPDPNKANERKYDTSLVDRIIAKELPGILAWCVRGALEYQRIGLKKPASVTRANKNYRLEEDTLMAFVEECCVVDKDCKVGSQQLYEAYRNWCADGFRLNSKEFPKQLGLKFRKVRASTGIFWEGIGLLTHDDIPDSNGINLGLFSETLEKSQNAEHPNMEF